MRLQHAQRRAEAEIAVRLVRLDVAREREHGRRRDDCARGADDERDRITREPRERAARNRAQQRAAALQPGHRGDRAAELVRRADVGEIRLAAQHPGGVTRPESDGRAVRAPTDSE